MALQAHIDDSYTRDGVLVLAGCMATAEIWANFCQSWEQMLPFGLRDERGYYFHMTEMASSPDRMERVGSFWRIIEEYKPILICAKINIADLRNALNRLWILNCRVNFGLFAYPHVMAFVSLVETLLKERHKVTFLDREERVDFILDEHNQDKFMKKFWSDFTSSKPDEVNLEIGKLPRFENDRKFLPLQAADLVAWWFRRWHEEGRISQNVFEPKFDGWKSNVPLNVILMEKSEDQIVDTLKGYIRASPGGKDAIVLDTKYPNPIV